MLFESGHVDGVLDTEGMEDGEGDESAATAVPAQDLHSMLEVILSDFRKICESGFIWNLHYRGINHKGIHFVPYVHFIKCDTDEADKLCGAYTSRGKYVSQLCRYCCCPTDESDQPRAKYARKTVPMIRKLVENDDNGRRRRCD